ncbi:hypothetical protein KJ586_04315, partial [Patescibacteria group bacterium]|nr:hypothetical protein [Patescibacteria group bacterium]
MPYILFFLILYIIISICRLDLAVMFLIAALPAYLIRFNILGMPVTLLEAMILIAFFIWFLGNCKMIFRNIKRKLKIENWKLKINNRYPFDIEIVLLLIVSFAAAGVAGFSASAMGIWKAYFFEPALVFILVFNVFGKHTNETNIERKERIKINGVAKILWPLAISAFVVSVFAIYQKFTGAFIFNELWAAEETRRVTSFFGYPNA